MRKVVRKFKVNKFMGAKLKKHRRLFAAQKSRGWLTLSTASTLSQIEKYFKLGMLKIVLSNTLLTYIIVNPNFGGFRSTVHKCIFRFFQYVHYLFSIAKWLKLQRVWRVSIVGACHCNWPLRALQTPPRAPSIHNNLIFSRYTGGNTTMSYKLNNTKCYLNTDRKWAGSTRKLYTYNQNKFF